MMLGDKIPATEAERMGMIYKFFGDEEFAEASLSIAKNSCQNANKRAGIHQKDFRNICEQLIG